MRHDEGNPLKYQDHRVGLRALPRNAMECGQCQCTSQVRLPPTARHIPRRERRSHNQRALLRCHDAMGSAGTKLTPARLTLMVLLAMVWRAMFLAPC